LSIAISVDTAGRSGSFCEFRTRKSSTWSYL
jgi:hypothetical protein